MNYAREVKALLLERGHVEALVSFPVKDRVFDHAITTAGVTLIRKGAHTDRPTRVIGLQSTGSAEAGLRAALSAGAPARKVRLRSDQRWSATPSPAAAADAVTLGELARVRRGIATGCNAFFVLSEARRVQLAIDAAHLVPCAASPRHFEGGMLAEADLAAMDDATPRLLLSLKKAPRGGPPASYLHRGRTEFAVRERALVRQRVKAGRKWFEVEQRAVDRRTRRAQDPQRPQAPGCLGGQDVAVLQNSHRPQGSCAAACSERRGGPLSTTCPSRSRRRRPGRQGR
jgi:adenine-specific DNA-methyltransferase